MDINTEYEKFTQDVYQILINAQGINTVDVKHNVLIKGRSGQKHQIDVYWEYSIGGINSKVAIECKNYKSKISVGKVRDFYGVLADIGNTNGIMVTKEGYQKGALEFAKHYGINLRELRSPKEKDWEGRIRSINLQMNLYSANIKDRIPELDQEWIRDNLKFKKGDKIEFGFQGVTNEIKIYDSNNVVITDFYQLDNKLPQEWKEAKDLEHYYKFEDGFIETVPHGKMKIKGISYKYDINSESLQYSIDAKNASFIILKDAIEGDIKYFDEKGNIK